MTERYQTRKLISIVTRTAGHESDRSYHQTAKGYRNISVFDKRPYYMNVIGEDVTAMRAYVYILSTELFSYKQRLINVVS